MHRKTFEMGPAPNAGLIQKMGLTGLPRAGLQHVLTVPVKAICIVRCNEPPQRATHYILPAQTQQCAGPQICLHNLTLRIQREIAERGKVVEF